jgi:hypothetical protein
MKNQLPTTEPEFAFSGVVAVLNGSKDLRAKALAP